MQQKDEKHHQEILEQLDAFARRVDGLRGAIEAVFELDLVGFCSKHFKLLAFWRVLAYVELKRLRFDDTHSCLEQLKEEDARLDAEALAVKSEYGAQLNEQMEELQRLEEEKVGFRWVFSAFLLRFSMVFHSDRLDEPVL